VKVATKALCACAALPFAAAAASASVGEERTKIWALKPEADTYVTAAEPHRNFGGARVLRADGSPQATTYLRFRLGKVKDSIAAVTLLVHAHSGDRAGFAVRRVPLNGWRERRLTYGTAPRPSLRYASSRPVQQGAWSAVDVTPFVGDSDDAITFAITTRSPNGVSFRSRESKQRPMLVVRSVVDRG
jgi:hypothetical protein